MFRVNNSSFLSSVAVLISGTAIAQILPILLSPVLSRLLTPEDFGTLGLFTAFVGMSATVIGLSFPMAIVSDIPERTSAQLTVLGLVVTIPMASLAVGLLAVLRKRAVLGFESLPTITLLCLWMVLISLGMYTSFRYWQVQQQGFGAITRATISQGIGRAVSQLVAGLLSLGGIGLVFGEVIGRAMGVSRLIRVSWSGILPLVRGTSWREYATIAKEFRKFPLITTPSSVLNSLSLELPVPLLTAAFSVSVSGQFSLAYRSLALPIAIIGSAVADVFHGQLARVASRSVSEAQTLFLRVAFILSGIGLIPAMIILFWGEEIFTIVFGSNWEEAGAIASAIILWLFASFVVSPLSRVVFVYRGQEWKLLYDVVALAGVIGAVWYGEHHHWSIVETSWLLGTTQAIAYMIYFAILWRILRSPRDNADTSDIILPGTNERKLGGDRT